MGISQIIFRALFICYIFSMSGCASAQTYRERAVDGNRYYVYPVAPGNTLYAISKQFSVEVDDLVKANPGADQGLSIGQEILVPIAAIDKRTARKTDIKTDGEHISHTVQKKETLFSLSKQYGVKVEEIIALNPGVDQTLSTGSVVLIPIQSSTAVDEAYLAPASNDSLIVHRIQSGETVYSISKKYEVSIDSLNAENDNFKSGIRVGQWITIPKYKQSFLDKLNADRPQVDSSLVLYEKGSLTRYKMAMLLPFELHQNDSLTRNLESGKELFVLTEIALEYYRGSMIALDSLKELGLNADIYVYDVGEDVVDAREVLRKPAINDVHIIFGPMHKGSLAVVSEMSRDKGVYLVSPNTFSNEVFEDNPYLFRSAASRETMLRYLANYIAIKHQNDNVIMVNSEKEKDWPYRKLFKSYYNSATGLYPNQFQDSLRSATKNAFSGEKIASWLRSDVKNILVVPSNELAFVSDFMTRLSRLSEKVYDIEVYGLDQWIRYDNIEAAYKNRFKLKLVVPSFVDYDDDRVIKYLRAYRERYEMEPSKWGYGFLGYDLTLFFGTALLKKGLSFPVDMSELEMQGVYTDYRFGRSPVGRDFENKSVYIVEYDNYTIKRVN